MIDHRWLPPREAVTLGRRAAEPSADPRWRDAARSRPRRRNPDEER